MSIRNTNATVTQSEKIFLMACSLSEDAARHLRLRGGDGGLSSTALAPNILRLRGVRFLGFGDEGMSSSAFTDQGG